MLDTIRKKQKLQDLPFGKDDVGTRFVILVIVMMTALATLALGGSEILLSLRAGWVDAVKGQVTVEIPATAKDGSIRTSKDLDGIAAKVVARMKQEPGVRDVHPLSRGEVADLIKPWLGDSAGQNDLPLPALIGLSFDRTPDAQAVTTLEADLQSIDPVTVLETHQSWLDDLRRFSGVLLAASALMAFAVIACCILCVSGAVNAQLASHQADIDLLHLMGATDLYIGAQFVRVVARDVGRAAAIGTAAGIALLLLARFVTGGIDSTILPHFSWSLPVFVSFAAVPAVVIGLCFVAARVTVLRSLEKMP